jgi:ATP-binding cassette, subfamily G (WHITE), eye pigment precursor transporter
VGQASAGDLVAVMGASGCGKSTLLKCLSLRDQGFRGGVYLNGAPVDKWYLSLVGFVDQYDLFIPTVTVREHLVFQALVRLPHGVPRGAKMARVQEVLIELNLGHVAESYVGGGKAMVRGLSGGEKRRLSFATEMLSDPHIIIADEATTGLDASMAKSVCRFLRGRADAGRIVVSSIHQPSSQTFAAFTHILLLAPQGRTAYFGPSAGLLEYLGRLGLRCPPYHNLADFAVRCVAIPPDDGQDGVQAQRVMELCHTYEASDLAEANRAWKTATILALLPGPSPSTAAAAVDLTGGIGQGGALGPRSASFSCLQLPAGGLALVGGKAGVVTGREYSAAWTTQFRHSLARQLLAAIRCVTGDG